MSRVSVLYVVLLFVLIDDEFVGVRGGVTPGECVDILSIAVVAFIFVIAQVHLPAWMEVSRVT
jgi:hypothetical protein